MMKKHILKILFLSILSFSSQSFAADSSSKFNWPEQIDGSADLFSFYPGSEVSMARTGRVLISYMVDKEGKTFAPMVMLANNQAFKSAAIKWVNEVQYSPATLDGVPVETRLQFRTGFNMAYFENSVYVSTKFFNKYYAKFNTEIEKANPDAEKLQKYLKKLTGTRHGNAYAHELLSSARYKYASLFGDRDDQIYALREMMLSNDKGMALAKSQIADKELIKVLIESKYYREAYDAYWDALYKHKGEVEESIKNQFEAAIGQIKDFLDSEQVYSRSIILGADKYTYLPLARKLFTFDQIEGDIEKLKLRCRYKFKELDFVPEADYQIPEKWGSCQLQILGAEGTKGNIIQL